MNFVNVAREDGIAVVTLARGKVNAINEQVIDELSVCFDELAMDAATRAVILTAGGRFFSFGFDVPELLTCSREDFTRFLVKFTELYTAIFVYPKPVVAALNGHTIAGGCMLATACHYRAMVTGKAKISLNEVTFGVSVFAGAVAMLTACVGQARAEAILLTGSMYSADEALELGLIHQKATDDSLAEEAMKVARDLARNGGRAFQSIKRLLRRPIAERMKSAESDSIAEFVDIWYSPATQDQLRDKTIRG